ncbi:MAG: ABC transporter ATP-binding protein [Treponema sp.]|jgi:ABC-2 type transport system ATP-binding protein|nr:ABC transporter ATP-binding protein [Treponema sp.]
MNNILEVKNLCKSYGTAGAAKAAGAFSLNSISFNVPYGYIMGFIGPNGAGKTTTIKSVLNVITKDSGNINLFGEENSVIQNENIGVVMDTPLFADDWTLKDTERAISPFYSNWDSGKYSRYLNSFSLDPKKKVKDLSRGMKVKLQISAALSHNARFLILDEPTSGLDPVARDEICDLLRGFICDEGKSVLFSTHITADLEKTADFITFILNGNIVFTGAKDALLEKYARVTGGHDDLSDEQKKLVIGYRKHDTGFEGMIDTANTGAFPGNVIIEQTTLDEIIIFMNKGAAINE